MATDSQPSTTESKKKKNKLSNQNRNRIIDMEIIWRVINWEWEGGDWGKRYRD